MHYIGLMSGTSVDAIDAVVISLDAPAGLSLKAMHRHPLPADVRNRIQALMSPGTDELDRLGELDVLVGELFADAALTVLALSGLATTDIRAIGSHGQTVRHRPQAHFPFSLQIGNPAVIAARTGICTVADFRSADIAAGGQGAPLVPAFHAWLFQSPGRKRVIVNIGGIANVTYIPGNRTESALGFDTGPGNTLLDQWFAHHHDGTHDQDGRWASTGKVNTNLLERMLSDPYFAKPPPKSTGREHFHLLWLESQLDRLPAMPPPANVQATLAVLTARSIVQAVRLHLPVTDEVYVTGGGCHNRHLMETLAQEMEGTPIATTEALGLHPDWVEAVAFGWLAHRALEGQPGNLPSVTGARRAVILGGIYKA